MTDSFYRTAFRFVAALLLAAAANAQETRSAVQGLVLDQQGASIVHATVVVTNTGTNVSNQVVTNDTGHYEANFLIPGNYEVSVVAPGFKKYTRAGIVVPLATRVEIDVSLELGGVTENVVVEAAAPAIDTNSATISGGRVMDSVHVEELPTFNNSSMMTIKLVPGMYSGVDRQYNGTNGLGGTSSAHTMGNVGGNDWSIDGAPDMGSGYTASYLPVSLAISEFKVATSQFDASAGHTTGSIISILTKSGTNQLHADMLYQFWNQRWNGAPFTTKQQYYRNIAAADAAGNTALANQLRNSPMQPSGHNQTYAFAIGAPVVIPKIFNGRNKLFTFFSFDGFNDRKYTRGSINHTVPTMPERQGDFRDLLAISAAKYQLYDPLSVQPDPARPGHYIRAPIPNNIIPQSRIVNPAYKTYVNFLPIPNALPTNPSIEPFNDYVGPGEPLNWTDYALTHRVDYQHSEKNRFFLRWTYQQLREDSSDWTYTVARTLMSTGNDRNFHNGTIDWVFTPTPNTFFDTVFSGNNFAQWSAPDANPYLPSGVPSLALKYKPSDVGLPAYMDAKAGGSAELPVMTWSGYDTLGRPVGTYIHWESLTAKSNMTHIWGRHTTQAGIDVRSHRQMGGRPGATSGQFNFTNAYTAQQDDALTASSLGHSWAAFLMGLPTTVTDASYTTYADSSPYYGWFVQDTFRVNSKLSLTFGFRLEVELGVQERYNRIVAGFNPTATTPITSLAQAAYAQNPIPELPTSTFQPVGGVVYPGVGGSPRRISPAEWFPMPRFGASYAINSKTVLRAGYGLAYDRKDANTITPDQSGFNRDTISPVTNDFGQTWLSGNPAAGVSPMTDPFPVRADGTRFDTAYGSSLGLLATAGLGWSFLNNQNPQRARLQHWRLEVERQLTGDMMVSVAYNGIWADRINVSRTISALPAQFWSTGLARNTANTTNLNSNVPNPFYIGNFSSLQSSFPQVYKSLAATPFFTSPTIRKSQLLRAYPQMNGLTETGDPVGESKAHSVEAQFVRRFARGFAINFAYIATYERDRDFFWNEFDALPSWELSNNVPPQRITSTGIYELPFGKTKPLLHNGLPSKLLGGFVIALSYETEPGPYLTWGNVFYYGSDLGAITKGYGSIQQTGPGRTLSTWFNTADFEKNPAKTPDAYNLRTFPHRVSGLRQNGLNQWNANVHRDFQLRESLQAQIRVDAINLFNHTQWAAPGLDPTLTTFGVVTSNSANPGRYLLFQAKIKF
jgi:hypothetical protein